MTMVSDIPAPAGLASGPAAAPVTATTTGADIAQRVAGLASGFRKRLPVSEAQRTVPRETIQELKAAGVARMMVPRERGGLDLGVRDLVQVSSAAAFGCPSTGWLASLMAIVPHTIGRFGLQAQEAVWADGPDVVAAGSLGAKATRVPGGYRVSGTHPFTSGVTNAEWIYLVGMVLADGAPPEPRLFLLPKRDVTVHQTWHTNGMRGTGSNTVTTQDVFVPEAFTMSQVDAREGATPGSVVNANPSFGLPWVATGAIGFVATMLGAVEGAYAEMLGALATKRMPNGKLTADNEVVTVEVAMTSARIDAARTLLLAMADRSDRSSTFTLAERAGITRDGTFITHLIVEAIDAIVQLSGTGAFTTGSFVQQAWRDIHFAAAHQGVNPRLTGGHYGRLALGLEEPNPPLFY